MQRVGIKVLKNRLSEYVRAAASGERVLVTDRDRVVAELVPPRRSALSDEEVIARGVAEGWLTPADVPNWQPMPDDGPELNEEPITFEQLMEDLARDREDR